MTRARVLLADRQQTMLGGLRSLLEPAFEVVGTEDTPRSLVEATSTLKPQVVVVDLSIAASDELDVMAELSKRHPEVKIVILSLYDVPSVVRKALAAGASGYVLKRLAVTDLIPAVQEVLEGGSYVSRSS